MTEDLQELLFALCAAPGTPGDESEAARRAAWELSDCGETEIDRMGNVICHMGNQTAQQQILLDAHLDQVGLIVTRIETNGFLRVDRCGGTDRRVLPGSPVTVFGKEPLTGIVCCMPPHLTEGGEDKVESVDRMAIDLGLSTEEAQELVSPGDRVLVRAPQKRLLGTRITSPALDDRAGCAALIRCAQLLRNQTLSCGLTILLSSREEAGGQGAQTLLGGHQIGGPVLQMAEGAVGLLEGQQAICQGLRRGQPKGAEGDDGLGVTLGSEKGARSLQRLQAVQGRGDGLSAGGLLVSVLY